MNTDRIEKSILLRAPRQRVWNAIADARQFGAWFGVEFDGPFVEGHALTGRIRPTQVDAEVAKLQEPMTEILSELRDEDGAPRLTITESGFDRIPLARRAKAFAANDGGWAHQM